MALVIDVAGSTIIGARTYQEDRFWWNTDTTQFPWLGVVSDGMGGHAAGDIASTLTVDTIVRVFSEALARGATTAEALRQAVISANQAVGDESVRLGHANNMGATVVAIAIHQNTLYWCSAGDSRLYVIRNGHAEQLTRDFTFEQDLMQAVEQGHLTREDVLNHPQRHAITSFMGTQRELRLDWRFGALQAGDYLMVCSDGIHGIFPAEEMPAIFQGSATEVVDRLFNQVVPQRQKANQDNSTAFVVRIVELESEHAPAAPPARDKDITVAMPAVNLPPPPVTTQQLPPLTREPAPAAPRPAVAPPPPRPAKAQMPPTLPAQASRNPKSKVPYVLAAAGLLTVLLAGGTYALWSYLAKDQAASSTTDIPPVVNKERGSSNSLERQDPPDVDNAGAGANAAEPLVHESESHTQESDRPPINGAAKSAAEPNGSQKTTDKLSNLPTKRAPVTTTDVLANNLPAANTIGTPAATTAQVSSAADSGAVAYIRAQITELEKNLAEKQEALRAKKQAVDEAQAKVDGDQKVIQKLKDNLTLAQQQMADASKLQQLTDLLGDQTNTVKESAAVLATAKLAAEASQLEVDSIMTTLVSARKALPAAQANPYDAGEAVATLKQQVKVVSARAQKAKAQDQNAKQARERAREHRKEVNHSPSPAARAK